MLRTYAGLGWKKFSFLSHSMGKYVFSLFKYCRYNIVIHILTIKLCVFPPHFLENIYYHTAKYYTYILVKGIPHQKIALYNVYHI